MSFVFESGNLVFVKAPNNNILGVECYSPWHFAKYLTDSYLLTEVQRNDSYKIKVSVN